MKAEGVCPLVLPGERVWLPFEGESSTCGQVGPLPTHWVGGEVNGFKKKKCERWGSLLGCLTARGKLVLLCESATVVPLLTNAASAPLMASLP